MSRRLVADIGGTNARFGLQRTAGGPVTDVCVLVCAEHESLADAIRAYLDAGDHDTPQVCAIAIATPVVGDQVSMTNHHWSFSAAALKAKLGFERLVVINDFTALALALTEPQALDLQQIGGVSPVAGCAIGLIGPGTGLGVSGLLPVDVDLGVRRWVPLNGEGGHVTLAGCDARENAVLAWLQRRHGHASAERALSGPGLVDLHRALMDIDGSKPVRDVTSAEITKRALQGDAACAEVVDLFCAFLGTASGNLALTLGARGGIYIGGGIVPRLGDWLAGSHFRKRFEAKGRLRDYLEPIPAFVIHAQQSPALLGAARALDG